MSSTTSQRSGGTLLRFHRLIRSNWISSLGAAIATFAAMGLVSSLFMSGDTSWGGPYIGLLTAIVFPLVILGGLLLIPCGLFLYRRKLAERLAALQDRPLHTARAVVALTALNFAALGTTGYASANYLSSDQFCGKACHDLMTPEYDAFLESPHSRIGCVACHVSPGAEGFVTAKLNGTRQLWHTLMDDYRRPIPTPVHDLPDTAKTCEGCHDPTRYLGTKLMVRSHYEANQQNTGFVNVVLMRRGGELPGDRVTGIHWHAHPSTQIDYLPGDPQRRSIPWVRAKYPDGSVKVFAAEGTAHQAPPADQLRRMDCTDCHNRVGHPMESAAAAVDREMSQGRIRRDLPFIKKHALEVLAGSYTREDAPAQIRGGLTTAYAGEPQKPEAAELDRIATVLSENWLRNNYPERKLNWDSYPDFNSHDGCFRCHDDKHKDAEGKVIDSRCSVCHQVLSEREKDPAILQVLGIQRTK